MLLRLLPSKLEQQSSPQKGFTPFRVQSPEWCEFINSFEVVKNLMGGCGGVCVCTDDPNSTKTSREINKVAF